MAMLLKYALETGAIVGAWESTTVEVLEAQRVEDDAVYGYLLCEPLVPASVLEQDYLVDGWRGHSPS